MKVLLVDVATDGHHLPYLKAFINAAENPVVVIPECDFNSSAHTYFLKGKTNWGRFADYLKWFKQIDQIVENEKPDVIHFVYGDIFYRYFGFGLKKLKKKCGKLIVTFHRIGESKIAKIRLKTVFKKITTGIVHTDFNLKQLEQLGIKNAIRTYYPQLYDFDLPGDAPSFRKKYGISKDEVVFSLIGGLALQNYKGLEILLDAVRKAKNEKIKVILAGRLYGCTIEQINDLLVGIQNRVLFKPGYLSDEEFVELIDLSDFVTLPYRKIFNGVSGPLTEAVWARRPVIVSDNKALGDTVKKFNLGYTFEPENSDELARTMDYAAEHGFAWNPKAEEYRNKISMSYFVNEYREIYK